MKALLSSNPIIWSRMIIKSSLPTNGRHNTAPDDSLIVTTDECWRNTSLFFAMAPEQMRRKAVTNTQRILENPGVRVVPHSRESFLSGMSLYDSRPDKGYSLTDCISMQTMRKERLTEILTNDRHFEQEGFRALFRDS